MSRFRLFHAALFALLLCLLTPQPAQAQSKKSSAKTGSSSSKKKAAAKSTAKKVSPTPAVNAGGSSLDLPLPEKVGAANAGTTDKGGASPPVETPSAAAEAKKERAPSATVEPETIVEFAEQPEKVQQLIRYALDLTRRNLSYTFGSADPEKGGMDCSGAIHHVLRTQGIGDVARDSSGQYLWARKAGSFYPVVSKSAESVEFEQLQPGDLMFWTGTYETGREVPISHVMMYLGREKGTKKRIMFGASDGRSYNGVSRWGVSVFDFKMPKSEAANGESSKVDFIGFARIPGLRTAGPVAAAEETAKPEPAKPPVKGATKPASKSKGSTTKKKAGK